MLVERVTSAIATSARITALITMCPSLVSKRICIAFDSVTTTDIDEVLKAFFDARLVFRVPFVEIYTLQIP